MNSLKRFLVVATMSAGLLTQAAIVPTTIMKPVMAAAPATTQAAAQAPQTKGKLIFIDPGHGSSDVGAVHETNGKVDLTERDVNLDVANRLARMLREAGYDVQMSRDDASALVPGQEAADLQARVDKANKANADLLISVHNNGLDNKATRGTEVWYCSDRPFDARNETLAKATQKALVSNLREAGYNTLDRGIKDDKIMGHFAVNGPNLARPSKMPSITGEPLFITNDQDAAQLAKPEIREAIARGYFQGIQEFYSNAKS
ncbi:MAG TPA: N-acetylmuramoyl-L-alanine amidase [Anaerolineae bacterium]|nr:N-acetylmuramoyl-L-alanine amidase [Anaerolineae bacterium]HPL27565.1 N-acetylmuramoyl-L-alanine amidase [Anaerolineae bacterium]